MTNYQYLGGVENLLSKMEFTIDFIVSELEKAGLIGDNKEEVRIVETTRMLPNQV